MEYRIRVEDHMRVWQMVGDEAEEVEPLGPGEYWFLRISSPVPKTMGYWLVLKEEYEAGVIIGRHDMSAGERFRQEEGFSIEVTVTRRNSREKQPA